MIKFKSHFDRFLLQMTVQCTFFHHQTGWGLCKIWFELSYFHHTVQLRNHSTDSRATNCHPLQRKRPSLANGLSQKQPLKSEGRAFRNIGNKKYIPDCKISPASFALHFHLLLIKSFIRIRYFSVFLSWFLRQKLNLIGSCLPQIFT